MLKGLKNTESANVIEVGKLYQLSTGERIDKLYKSFPPPPKTNERGNRNGEKKR